LFGLEPVEVKLVEVTLTIFFITQNWKLTTKKFFTKTLSPALWAGNLMLGFQGGA